MKRISILLITALLFGAAIHGQSLLDNTYFLRSVELRTQAREAFDAGNYGAAAEYAAQAKEFARLSDEYVEGALTKDRADRAYSAAQVRMTWARQGGVPANHPAEWALASSRMDQAREAYGAERWQEATDLSNQVLEALANVRERHPWPRYYTVRLIPERRDCLWRIAEYTFIYNDPFKWPVIFEANKKTFVNPNNPDLILPGQVLEIPSIRGETRMGTFDPSRLYEAFPKR